MLVSVIIPCFNAARTLAETVASVDGQSHADIEIIIVDDGSTDGSSEIIKSFGARVIGYFGPNRGASMARNLGTSLAKGDYIQYLDSDDLLSPDAITRRVNALNGAGADVAYSDWQKFSDVPDGERSFEKPIVRRMEDVDPDAQIACATTFWAPPAALLYRRATVDAIGGWNPGLPVIQDARFLFDAARSGASFVHVDGVSALYRVAADSLSRRNDRAFVIDVYANACEIQSLWEADGPLSNRRKAALAGIFDYAARDLLKFECPQFDDAVDRFKQMSSRRFGYPESAQRLSRLIGRRLATRTLNGAMEFLKPLRRIANRA